MSCKFAQSGPNSAAYTITKPNQSTKARSPESISFSSQTSISRISIKNRSGPRWARKSARIAAFYDVTAGSPYEVLGIDESVSSIRDIKKAYKKLAIKYHPDVSPPDRVDENTRRFIMVKRAYETLTNPQYDAGAHDQRMEEKEEWKMKWQSQLDELKRRSKNTSRSGRVSWGARMRAQT